VSNDAKSSRHYGRSMVMPFVALKVFCNGRGSGNLLFGGRKTGQEEVNFFAHCVCTHFTERCSFAMWPSLRILRRYSDFPTQSGLSDFASVTQDGAVVPKPEFPWALILRPMEDMPCDAENNFLEQLGSIRPNTKLYKIIACATPDDAVRGHMENIGVLVTVSDFIESSLESRMRFRHHLKEDDYKLRPDWKAQLTPEHKNYGWEHFEKYSEDVGGEPLPCIQWTSYDSPGNTRAKSQKPKNGMEVQAKDYCPYGRLFFLGTVLGLVIYTFALLLPEHSAEHPLKL